MAALEGRCDDGSLIYEKHGNGRCDRDKHWWVQAENVIGQVYLAVFHNKPEMLEKAYQSWQYINNNIVDHENGEWHWSRKNGEINRDDDKAGCWKCPYHNTRMCLEVYERLADLK
jgi:mannobiose 2-epimerase